jgi:hypothetical protein
MFKKITRKRDWTERKKFMQVLIMGFVQGIALYLVITEDQTRQRKISCRRGDGWRWITSKLPLSLWNDKLKYNGKDINVALCCCNRKCGITIDHDINGDRNIYVLLTKMIQKEKWPGAFCCSRTWCYVVW